MANLFCNKLNQITDETNLCGVVQTGTRSGQTEQVVTLHFCDANNNANSTFFVCNNDNACHVTGNNDHTTKNLSLSSSNNPGLNVDIPKCGDEQQNRVINQCNK